MAAVGSLLAASNPLGLIGGFLTHAHHGLCRVRQATFVMDRVTKLSMVIRAGTGDHVQSRMGI